MMRMVDLGSQRGPLQVIDTATTVDCAREVRYRRSFRSLVECVVPCCGLFQQTSCRNDDDDDASNSSIATTFIGNKYFCRQEEQSQNNNNNNNNNNHSHHHQVTGTFFGNRKGRVSFCLQLAECDTNSSSSSKKSTTTTAAAITTAPLLLLEFGIPTAYLAREMQSGSLRIALECDRRNRERSASLYDVPVWTIYCNGRRVGFAVRRKPSAADAAILKLMRSVSVGAGVMPVPASNSRREVVDMVMYLRASFQRVIGSPDSEAFHIINPAGSSAQELSIFLLRSS